MALSSLSKRTVRFLWGWLLPLSTASILVMSCASAPGTAAPTPTIPAVYATAAAQTAVWQTLQQRPLHVPTGTPGTPCATAHGHWLPTGEGMAVGSGPVHAVLGQVQSTGGEERQRQGILQFEDAHAYGTGTSGWGGMKVLWVIDAHYSGQVLIRGHQVDGPHEVRFNGGLDQLTNTDALSPPLPALRLLGPPPETNWPSQTRLQAPGCYAYQVDGLTFREVIVFQAVLIQHP
jgi:hypothetical protein